MTKLIEATVQGNDQDGYWLNPDFGEYEDMTIADWKATCAADGIVVTENPDLDGRIENQQGTVYHCAASSDEYVDVCVWEETN